MTIRHHLDDATLMGYAAGSLSEAHNLIVAAHVSLCDTCRATAESFDTLGGQVLTRADHVAMSPDSLTRTLARAEAIEAAPATPAPRRRGGTLPAPVQDYVGGDLESIRWRPVGMGVKQAILPTSDLATARLLCIPAGAAMPDHSHSGPEYTLVLQGAFSDEDETFARGDIEIADQDVTHTPVALPGEACICLAVTDAPLRFKGWLPRLVQRFVGI
jgi:putative transcriptional regulator